STHRLFKKSVSICIVMNSMKGGEVRVKQRVREILRYAGALLPMALAIYGVFTGMHVSRAFQADYLFSLVMIPWLALGLVIFISPAKRPADIILRLTLYHLLAGAYIVCISGFMTPFVTLGWVLLLLVSYIYFANKGLVLNLSILSLVAIADILLNSASGGVISTDILSVCSIL